MCTGFMVGSRLRANGRSGGNEAWMPKEGGRSTCHCDERVAGVILFTSRSAAERINRAAARITGAAAVQISRAFVYIVCANDRDIDVSTGFNRAVR